ncbi:IS607 family transposase [Neobacillus soli]|uniref:IS607 family transposase n=1 Tax=Neobacillus soli TaxID=220688 RepID=UPI0008246A6C|nr:IS607 family transposase [Neobacillus soli]
MEKLFRMNDAAKILGVTIKTLQRWDHSGKATFVRTPNGQRRLPESEINRLIGTDADKVNETNLVIYARVSSHEQKMKGDLQRQIDFIKRHMDLNSFQQVTVIEDVGSGLNDKRKGLVKIMKLAEAGLITDLAIRYRDRLTRFGFHYLQTYFESHQVTLHILDDQTEEKAPQEELVDDLIAIITSFSGKLYGIRSHKNKMVEEKVKEVLEDVANLPNETT